MLTRRWFFVVVVVLLVPRVLRADDLAVATRMEFIAALDSAQPGDRILLAPGTYAGGLFKSGLSGVTIRSAELANPAVIEGGTNGIQLSDATSVTIEHLVFDGATSNGINIDDGGSFATPSTDITIRDVTVRNVGTGGNHDGIKLSGVTGFSIDRVRIVDWGDGGSAIDPVGSHNGLIQNSLMRHTTSGSSGVRPKGGSKNITIRANRIELPAGVGRAIQAGGSTGAEFFRFIDGDSGYEADHIVAEGNVVIGSSSPFSWVNIDGGIFHHNLAQRPVDWAFRILNENTETEIIDTQGGTFDDNVIVFNDTDDEWRRAGNFDGPGVLEETFHFARNQWFNLANPTPAGSTPQLPVAELDGVYGIDPDMDPDGPIVWTFPWGAWIVNATSESGQVDIGELPGLRATAGSSGQFDPLAAVPFRGAWEFDVLAIPSLELQPFSQAFLVDSSVCLPCNPLPGDYDKSGEVGPEDYAIWRAAFGSTNPSRADGNLDGRVTIADYVVWRNRQGNVLQPPPGAAQNVPESAAFLLFLEAFSVGGLGRWSR